MSLSHSEPMSLPERPHRAVARSVIGYSLLTALMFATHIVVFVPAALIHCAIRNGRRAAWLTLAAAALIFTLVVAVPALTQKPEIAKFTWSFLAMVTIAIALPAMAALPMVERGEKFGQVLAFLLVASAVGLVVVELGARSLFGHSPFAAEVAQAEVLKGGVLQFYKNAGVPPASLDVLDDVFRVMVYVLPASLLAQFALNHILSLLMLGRLKAWRDRVTLRGGSEALGAYRFRNFALPDWLLFAFILGGLTPLATGLLQRVAANVLTLVVFLYILQGLAIFRFLLAALGVGLPGLFFGFSLLVLLTLTGFLAPLLLGLAGLFDPFFDFRRFKKRKDDSNGNESHSD